MTPEERAAGVLEWLERKGIQPFDDTYWMNPEDRDAITTPIALAIRAAEVAAVEAERERVKAHEREIREWMTNTTPDY